MKGVFFWTVVYVSSVLLANYTAEIFIPFPVFGLLSVGTLIFGITFTARDYVHSAGRKYVYAVIAISAILALIMSGISEVPIRIIFASFFTILVSEAVDTEVYQKFIKKTWLFRVAASNGVSVPVDSILFSVLAFAGVMSAFDVTQIIFADIVVKYAVSMLFVIPRYFVHNTQVE